MKTIIIYHLWSDCNDYIVEIDDISYYGNKVFLKGYIVDSTNEYMPTGESFCFSFIKSCSYNLLHSPEWYSRYNTKLMDIINFPNWFERLIGKI